MNLKKIKAVLALIAAFATLVKTIEDFKDTFTEKEA